MKTLLIRPPAVTFEEFPALIVNEPLGLLYLAGYLKKNKKAVAVIDACADGAKFQVGDFCGVGMPYETLSQKIRDYSPDLVGISCMFTQYLKGVHDVAGIVKDISKGTLVVCGGVAASASFAALLEDPNIDLVVKGEGEETLLDIVERTEKGLDLKGVCGTVLKVEGKISINAPREFIKNLDELAFPARELLDMSKYYDDPYSAHNCMRYPRLSMVTSRGCPFKCVFCSIHSVWEHRYRARSAENVCDEIELLRRAYGVKEIIFYDDNLTVDKKRINDICLEIKKRKIDIKWSTPNGVAIWTLDENTLMNMKQAGCYKIAFGLESAAANTLKFIHKEFLDFNRARELIRFSNKVGLWTMASFIIGFPYETKDDVMETLAHAIDSDVDSASFYSATPYPGSELYDICKKEGFMDESDIGDILKWQGQIGLAMLDMKYLTKEEINFLTGDLRKRFVRRRVASFLNPLRILRKATGKDEIKYIGKVIKNYFPFIMWVLKRT